MSHTRTLRVHLSDESTVLPPESTNEDANSSCSSTIVAAPTASKRSRRVRARERDDERRKLIQFFGREAANEAASPSEDVLHTPLQALAILFESTEDTTNCDSHFE